MNANAANAIPVIFLVGVLLIAYMAWFFSRSRSVLEQWAEANGYEILHSEYRNLFRGPFFWDDFQGADRLLRQSPGPSWP